MEKQIVAVSVDKIQTFLTQVIHSHVQENQTEDATLQGIMKASYEISDDFFKAVRELFPEEDNEILLACSGVYIFQCSLCQDELEVRLNSLFSRYYLESQGQKQIRWTHFSAEGTDKISSIQKAKKELRKSKNWNRIVEKNRDLLFQFHSVKEANETGSNVNIPKDLRRQFSRDINDLYKKSENQEDRKHFRIAVLKADLNGMGVMFKEIQSYSTYKAISEILNEEVSMRGLYRAAAVCAPKGKEGWLFPFYIAGDDIFFAVAVEDLICGVNVCRTLMKNVNEKIEKRGCKTKLSMSVGIEITVNKMPIRYYMDMVEAQLKNAKSKAVPQQIEPFFIMKISLGDVCFFDIDYSMMKEKKADLNHTLIWQFFCHDMRLLNYIRSDESGCSEVLGKPNFFYTLLEDISDETVYSDSVKYMNHVLYHLMPRHLGEHDPRIREWEQILNYRLIRQLYGKDGKESYIHTDEDTKKRFEGYLRLIILCSDVRFCIIKENNHENYKEEYRKDKKDIIRFLFKKPRKFLYQNCLKNVSEELTNLLVKEVYNPKLRKGGFQKIVLEKSMLFRLRDVGAIPLQKAARMIKMVNPQMEKEIHDENTAREKEGKLPNRLYFDENLFYRTAKETQCWKPDFIDSLMLFYQYNSMTMEMEKKDKKGKKNEKTYKDKGKKPLKPIYWRNTKTI